MFTVFSQQPSRLVLAGPVLKHTAVCIGLAVGVLLATYGHAQSLQELYEAARNYDATYIAARALADSAHFKAAQTRALRRPSADLTASATRNREDFPDRAGSVNPPTENDIGTWSLEGKYPLFDSSSDAFIDQANKTLAISRLDFNTVEQELIVRVAQAYFDVLAAEDTLSTAVANKAAIAEQLASAQRNFEVGTATITDTREAQARFDLATAQEIGADNDLLTKRIALDQVVGRDNVYPWRLATPITLPALHPPQVNDWVARADAEHPAVLRARLALDIAQLEIDRARAEHLPTVDVVATASNSHSNAATTFTSAGTTKSGAVGLQFRLPLFAGFRTENHVKEALLLEEKVRNDFKVARRGTAQETRRLFFGVRSGHAQVKALEAAESSSQLALEATQLGYSVGVRVNLDVLNAQTQLYNARRDLAKSRYDVLINGLKLRLAAGVLRPEDVTTINRLLVRQADVPSVTIAEPIAVQAAPAAPTAENSAPADKPPAKEAPPPEKPIPPPTTASPEEVELAPPHPVVPDEVAPKKEVNAGELGILDCDFARTHPLCMQ